MHLRRSRGRAKQGRILIDGARELARALDAGVQLLELFVRDPLPERHTDCDVVQQVSSRDVTISRVSSQVFAKIAYGDRDGGLVAVATPPQKKLDELVIAPDSMVAVLEHLEKPGNVGAIVRTADAAGAAAVIVTESGTDLFNPNTIRSSLGTIFTVPTISTSAETAAQWLREHGFQLVASRVDAPVVYSELEYGRRTAIVLGSEAEGLSDFWQGDDICAVSLPMRGQGDSLNVASTAAVLFYEVMRQRGLRG